MKKITTIAALAATALMITACGGKEVKYTEPSDSVAPAEPTPTEQLPPSDYVCAADPAPSYCKK